VVWHGASSRHEADDPPLELGERIGQLNVDDIVRLSHAVFLGLAGA